LEVVRALSANDAPSGEAVGTATLGSGGTVRLPGRPEYAIVLVPLRLRLYTTDPQVNQVVCHAEHRKKGEEQQKNHMQPPALGHARRPGAKKAGIEERGHA